MSSVPPEDREPSEPEPSGHGVHPSAERDPDAGPPPHRTSTPGYLDEAGVGHATRNDAVGDESIAHLGGAGTGYTSAVDGRGVEGAGEDVSGDEYTESEGPGGSGTAPRHGAHGREREDEGRGYVSAVDGRGTEGAGEDVSGGDYTEEDPDHGQRRTDDVLRMDSSEQDRH